jgi:hypothetical protein
MNTSDHSKAPRASSRFKNVRQIFNHRPCRSHCCNRRQQVAGLGYRSGRSFHRAPVRKTQRIPSSVRRSSCQGRPRIGWRLGRWGSIKAQVSSDKNWSRMTSISLNTINLCRTIYETASQFN